MNSNDSDSDSAYLKESAVQKIPFKFCFVDQGTTMFPHIFRKIASQ